jgi:NitT/TauT family transport system substrate-binding protein
MPPNSFALARGAFVATGLAMLAAPAFAAEPHLTAVRVGATPDVDVVTALWAVRSGIFANNGLDVRVERLNSGSDVSAAVIGHSIDIGRSSIFGLLEAHLKGVPFELVSMSSPYDSAAPNSAFVVAKDSPIQTPRDLAGKTIATPSVGDYFTLVTSAWVDQNGGDSHSLKFLAMPLPLAAEAVKARRVDGANLVDPFLQEALLPSGGAEILGYPSDTIAPKYGVTYYFCLQDYARQNPDVIARFQRSIATSVAYAQTHRSQMDPLVIEYTKIDPAIVAEMPLDIGSGLDPKMIQPVIDFAARYKFIAHAFPAAEISVPQLTTSG